MTEKEQRARQRRQQMRRRRQERDGQEKKPLSARRRRNRRWHYIYEAVSLLLYGLLVYALCIGAVRYVGQKTMVEGSSMAPTLEDGDHLLVDKLTYRFSEPERFDIVVFRYLHLENSYYIKRVIGLPGETVQIQDGIVYINGEPLEESYGLEAMQNPGRAAQPITLGEDEYFVLGDNRNLSSDSRDPMVANVAREQIVGRAVVRVYPFDRLAALGHK